MKRIHRIFAGLGLILLAGTSQASLLCSDGATYTGDLDESDVTWTYDGSSQNADDCWGQMTGGSAGNDDASDVDAAFGGTWEALAKSDDIGGTEGAPDTGPVSDTGSYMGIDFTLTTNCDGGCASTSGTYTLSWTDPGDPDLPLTFDFVVAVKGGNGYGLYLFDDVTIAASPAEGGGSWEVTFVNGGGNFPKISHLTIYVTDGSTTDVPEPGTLSLLGLGLLGLGLVRRRKAQA